MIFSSCWRLSSAKRMFEKYYVLPQNTVNLTPLSPSLQGNGDFKASLLAGERS